MFHVKHSFKRAVLGALAALTATIWLGIGQLPAQVNNAFLSPVPIQQFFSVSGVPLAGGKLCTYIAGTTTPAATYTDATGTIANTNPIVLDSGGRAVPGIFLLPAPAQYKFTLYDSTGTPNQCNGNQQWSVDHIQIGGGSGGGGGGGGGGFLGPCGGGVWQDTGQASQLAITPSPALTTYSNAACLVQVAFPNAGSSTLNVNALGPKPLVNPNLTGLMAGQLTANAIILAVYNATVAEWEVIGGLTTSGSSTQLAGCPNAVNLRTGSSYTFLFSDNCSLISFSNSTAIAATLPQAGSTGFQAGWLVYVNNRGVGAVTITPTISTIQGAAAVSLATNQGILLVSDGTNYYAEVGRGSVHPNLQTGTSYTVTAADHQGLISFNSSSPVAVTLPQAGTTGFETGVYFFIQDRGTAAVTITPTTSTIDGGASVPLTTTQGILVVSDGTNYYTMRGITGSIRRTCMIVLGADNGGSALGNSDISPQKGLCFIGAGGTVQEITVEADAGTPSVIVSDNHAGTQTALLSAALATAASGGIACSNVGGTLGIDGATTCSATLQNTSIAAGDWIDLTGGVAGGTAKRFSIAVTWQ